MRIRVIADDPSAFAAWATDERTKAALPHDAAQQRGEQYVTSMPCANCHTISGTSARGNHEPLISAELFQTVQTRTTSKGGVSHKKLSSDFPLRGVVQCAKCKKPLTAGWAKGRKERYARYWVLSVGLRLAANLPGYFAGRLRLGLCK